MTLQAVALPTWAFLPASTAVTPRDHLMPAEPLAAGGLVRLITG
ncbi:hypothetical protein [Kibdelosporangium aridum]|nr:hypothetical protein [Kibdelosporangium aridum]